MAAPFARAGVGPPGICAGGHFEEPAKSRHTCDSPRLARTIRFPHGRNAAARQPREPLAVRERIATGRRMDRNKAKDTQHRAGLLGMNTPPIVSPEAWDAARQEMLVKEKALMRASPRTPADAVDGPGAAPELRRWRDSSATSATRCHGLFAQFGSWFRPRPDPRPIAFIGAGLSDRQKQWQCLIVSPMRFESTMSRSMSRLRQACLTTSCSNRSPWTGSRTLPARPMRGDRSEGWSCVGA
jgi:hypothetical protein